MSATDPGEQAPRQSGVTRKSSPGAYALARQDVRTLPTAEQRIAGIKAYHEARMRLAELAEELATAPAGDIIPGVTAVYVEAMRQHLQVLLLNSDVAEGL
jgi:hypothetical protein